MRIPREEDGAVLILVVLTIVALFGIGALAVDAGSLWMERRSMVTATDAAALAAAASYGRPSDSTHECGRPALQNLVAANATGATIENCSVQFLGPNGGYVTVTAQSADVPVAFGQVLGLRESSIPASSTAMWGTPSSVIGLRPIALCMNHPAVVGIMAAEIGQVHRVPISPSMCDGAPGNWTWISFDGTTSNNNLGGFLRNGYHGAVAVGDCYADGSNLGCLGVPGNRFGSTPITSALNHTISTGEEFAVFLYKTTSGGGEQARYDVAGFLGVVLRGYGSDGAGWLDLEFRSVTLEAGATCCDATAPGAGLQILRLCGTDNDPIGVEVRCAQS